ncbi:hypothetical protein RFI_07925, partial [Reticulomyxa filosa]
MSSSSPRSDKPSNELLSTLFGSSTTDSSVTANVDQEKESVDFESLGRVTFHLCGVYNRKTRQGSVTSVSTGTPKKEKYICVLRGEEGGFASRKQEVQRQKKKKKKKGSSFRKQTVTTIYYALKKKKKENTVGMLKEQIKKEMDIPQGCEIKLFFAGTELTPDTQMLSTLVLLQDRTKLLDPHIVIALKEGRVPAVSPTKPQPNKETVTDNDEDEVLEEPEIIEKTQKDVQTDIIQKEEIKKEEEEKEEKKDKNSSNELFVELMRVIETRKRMGDQ